MTKHLLTLILLATTALGASAQDADDTRFQFVDAQGNTVADGSTVTVTTGTTDDEGLFVMLSGLYVKNNGASEETYLRVNYTIENIDNGAFQICFPMNCVMKTDDGTYVTSEGNMETGETRDLQTEWFAESEGSCTATLTIETLSCNNGFPRIYTHEGTGPTITLKFVYDATNVNSVGTDESPVVARYTTDGRKLGKATKGINLVRHANGTIEKVLTK